MYLRTLTLLLFGVCLLSSCEKSTLTGTHEAKFDRELKFNFNGNIIDLENFGRFHNSVIEQGKDHWRIVSQEDYCANLENMSYYVAEVSNSIKNKFIPHLNDFVQTSCEVTRTFVMPQNREDMLYMFEQASEKLIQAKVIDDENQLIIEEVFYTVLNEGTITEEKKFYLYTKWNEINTNSTASMISGIILSVGTNSVEYWANDERILRGLFSIAAGDVLGGYISAMYEVVQNWGCGCWEGEEMGSHMQQAIVDGAIQSSIAGFIPL